jgi:hypothetical protein
VAAGDVRERRDHHCDREPLRDCDPDQPSGADHDRPAGDEDQREGADELGRAAAEVVAFHAGRTLERRSDGTSRPKPDQEFAEPVALSSA